MKLKLLVIRTADMVKLIEFYQLLGFSFDYHKHGNSPYHYSATVDGTVIEVYPLTKNQTEADTNLRLGFELDDFDRAIVYLKRLKCNLFPSRCKLILVLWQWLLIRMVGGWKYIKSNLFCHFD